MHGVVNESSNSAAVRVPAAVPEAAQVHLDQPINIRANWLRVRAKLVALIG
jgi:antitoxin component of MazEF toxin-antitoxin module